jgi:amidase
VYTGVITVPAEFTSTGVPVGITFFGKPYSEPAPSRLAYLYQQATHKKPPPKTRAVGD